MDEWEILAGLPPYGPEPRYFSATGQGKHREGLVVRFHPAHGQPWIGNFQRGFGPLETVLRHPNVAHIVVVAGGTAYIVEPLTGHLVRDFGADLVNAIHVPSTNTIVFSNGLWFEALGVEPNCWRSRRLSWDGVRHVRLEDSVIRGEAYNPMGDVWSLFEIDVATGEVTGGSYNGPHM